MAVQAQKGFQQQAFGVYLHVPFCATSCDFCAFYQEQPRREDLLRYLEAMEAELRGASCPERVKTVFWGGGTPGLLPAKDLRSLGERMLEHLNVRESATWQTPALDAGTAPSVVVAGAGKVAEWTVEMAPSTVKADKLKALRDLGVTRISMGVQSFQEDLLEALGRQHGPKVIYRAYDLIRSAGFESVNFDLMFALPGQSEAGWLQDLQEALSLEPEHISTYCLTFEEDTKLWVKLAKGQIKRDVELEADFYLRTWETLEAAGYPQYEVSNFARPGHACIHNCDTWRMESWHGFGPSGSSQYQRKRFTNVHDLVGWREAALAGKTCWIDEMDLSSSIEATDSLVFGLRMNAGVDIRRLRQRFSAVDWQGWDALAPALTAEGLLEEAGESVVRLTNSGRLVADQIGVAILEAF